MVLPIFIPIGSHTSSSYDDAYLRSENRKLQESLNSLEDTLAEKTGIETESYKLRKYQQEKELKLSRVRWKLDEQPRDSLELIVFDDIAENIDILDRNEYHFKILDTMIEWGGYYYFLSSLKISEHFTKPTFMDWEVIHLKRKILRFIPWYSGWAKVKIVAPKCVLAEIKKRYVDEYLPTIQDVINKYPGFHEFKKS